MIGIGERVGTLVGVRVSGPGREFLIDDEPVDIFIEDGRISDIAPTGAVAPQGETVSYTHLTLPTKRIV